MRFQSVDVLEHEPPFTAELIASLGLRGIHCGSARKLRPDWLNTDHMHFRDQQGRATEQGRIARVTHPGTDTRYYLEHDAVEPFPCEDESFEWAFAEHFLEHLTPEEATSWMGDVRRLLKPGGVLRVTTPDLRKYAEGYLDPEGRFFAEHRERLGRLRDFADSEVPARRAWMVNQIFQMWTHKWIYDFDEVLFVAQRAGFEPDLVVERAFRDGPVPELHQLDLPMRSDESLYVEITRT